LPGLAIVTNPAVLDLYTLKMLDMAKNNLVVLLWLLNLARVRVLSSSLFDVQSCALTD